jgi:hypothetical protein
MIGQVLQGLKDAEKQIVGVGATRELANVMKESKNDPDLKAAFLDIQVRGKELLKEAWNLAITDPEEAMGVMEDLKGLQEEWSQMIQDWREARDGGNGVESTSTVPAPTYKATPGF